MINLDEFNDIMVHSGRARKHYDYISVTSTSTALIIKASYNEVVKYFGNSVSIKVSDDLSKFIIFRGDDRRIASDAKKISILGLAPAVKKKYGDNVARVYYTGKWDQTANGMPVYVLTATGKVEHKDDIKFRKLVNKK